ncbi:MAG: hypothetical protein NUK65_13935, partial [Firmicutes bacterium]|nr:hypothetical protein [Bacillota bacterium]
MKQIKPNKYTLYFFYTLALVSALTFNAWTTRTQTTSLAHIAPTIFTEVTPEPPPPTTSQEDIVDVPDPMEKVHTEAEMDMPTESASEPTVQSQPKTRNTQLADRKGAASTEASVTIPPAKPAPDVTPPTVPEAPPAPPATINDTNLNSYVLDIIPTYTIGNYPYLLNNDYSNYNGVTENLSYKGSIIAKANPTGNRASHCSGITFEVFFKAMQARNRKLNIPADDFNGMSFGQLQDFQMNWYVASGNKRVSNIAVAVEKYGLGKQIHSFEDAKRGDFLDFSRSNNTGHTVVFLNWVRNDSGKIIGLHYWSSQG